MTVTVVKKRTKKMPVTAQVKDKEPFVLLERESTPYSKSEREMFQLMPKDGTKVSTKELAEMRQKVRRDRPIEHGRPAVNVIMTSLMNKIKDNKQSFVLRKSKPKGPYPVSFWLEPKQTKDGK
jgi:hypothetical protein